MKIRKIITIVAYVCTIVVASIWYGQHHGLLPEASSEEANLYDALFSALITVAFGLFLLVESLLILFSDCFSPEGRRRNRWTSHSR
jgi:cytochrome c oxidase subunit 2